MTELAGQDWTSYHATDDRHPYFEGAVGYTRRPAMIDPLDWPDGWPTVRGGWWVSDCRQPSPDGTPPYVPSVRTEDAPGTLLPEASDEFDGPSLGPQWSWIREPAAGSWAVSNGQFRFDTQNGDLYGSQNNVGVLISPAPAADLLVEARVRHPVPDDGGVRNYTQVGLAFYGGDDDYVKLVHVAIGSSRQTEFAKEESQVPSGYPFYGGARVGPPADWTWLRIVRRLVWGGETYTGYTSRDGTSWTRGATWRHSLGDGAKIALVAMSGAGWSGYFDSVRTFTLAPGDCADACDNDGDGLGDRATATTMAIASPTFRTARRTTLRAGALRTFPVSPWTGERTQVHRRHSAAGHALRPGAQATGARARGSRAPISPGRGPTRTPGCSRKVTSSASCTRPPTGPRRRSR